MKLSAIFASVSLIAFVLSVDEAEGQIKTDSTATVVKKTSHLTEPVTFRGKQFTTIVPGGWVVSFPSRSTRYQIAKPSDNKLNYKAIIRLDAGKPVGDLTTTANMLRKRFGLKETSASYDWAGENAILLEGDAKGIAVPQRILCTQRAGTIFMLFIALDNGVDVETELKYILQKWSWDED